MQNYILDKLTLSDLTDPKKIVIPSFQRGIVWSKDHRKDFIETVKTGDPFGVVLVSQARPNDPYILIDGLQRLSTLKAYMTNPLEFVDENDKFIDKSLLHKLFEAKYNAKGLQLPKEEKLDKEKKSFLKKMIALMKAPEKTPEALELWPDLSQALDVSQNDYMMIASYSKFYQSFMSNLQLPDIIIHAIVYQGPQDRLPTVFEHLNTTSVTLSKYEVFSSQWPTIKIVIDDEDIIKSVWSKYAALKSSSSFEVDTTEESIKENGLTLFEYCFAMSEILNDENQPFSYMFSKTKKSTDPTGFDLLALACGLQVNRADKICDEAHLGGCRNGQFFLDLKKALIDAILVVHDCLKDYVLDMRGSAIKNNNLYQIYHMVISVFNHLYDLNLAEKTITVKTGSTDKTWMDSFRKYAYKWYLLHRLNAFWNDNRQVSDLRRLLDDADYKDIYITNIPQTVWEDALMKYVDGLKKEATTRVIANDTKLILNYYYKMLIREDNNRIKYFTKQGDENVIFDIEHIAPVDKFKKFNDDLPMSTLGNLCYLPVKDNRSKRDKTIYAYAEDRPSLTFNSEFLQLIDYPSRENLLFVDFAFDDFQRDFSNMVAQREASMIKKLVELIMTY